MFSMVLVGSGSVSFDADPDSGSSHFLIRIRIQGNDTDSTDPDPQHCSWECGLLSFIVLFGKQNLDLTSLGRTTYQVLFAAKVKPVPGLTF